MDKKHTSLIDLFADDTYYFHCPNCYTRKCEMKECVVGGEYEAVSISLQCKRGHDFKLIIETCNGSIHISAFADDNIDYKEYIKSEKWCGKADEAKEIADFRCQLCNTEGDFSTLHAHHRTYERLGEEEPEDITVLCAKCHAKFHDLNKKPTRTVSKYKVTEK